jgi:hypothetical protein
MYALARAALASDSDTIAAVGAACNSLNDMFLLSVGVLSGTYRARTVREVVQDFRSKDGLYNDSLTMTIRLVV